MHDPQDATNYIAIRNNEKFSNDSLYKVKDLNEIDFLRPFFDFPVFSPLYRAKPR